MLCPLLVCLVFIVPPPPPQPGPADGLKEFAGRWEVADVQATQGQKLVPAELLGLTKKGTEVTVTGNQLTSGGELLATLTTDFSDSGLDLDNAVFAGRRPVLLTLPSGKGLLCAYECHDGRVLTLCYPHRMGRVTKGTWLTVARPAK